MKFPPFRVWLVSIFLFVTIKDNGKNKQEPKGPDKPAIPYMRFHRKVNILVGLFIDLLQISFACQVFESVRTNYPDQKVWELSRIIGQMWRELDDNERQPYIDEFEAEKVISLNLRIIL